MVVQGKDYRTIWMEGAKVLMIEQNLLPFEFRIFESGDYLTTCHAIKTMIVRGAGAIGAAAGFAMAQAILQAPEDGFLSFVKKAKSVIESTRPTARNLFYAVDIVYQAGMQSVAKAVESAQEIADKDAADSQAIGNFGNSLIEPGFKIETHCNAGWLAFVDFGTALSPIYKAHAENKNIFVWVDETRPRGQGARLTAWELQNVGIPHKIVPDTAGAWLMSQGKVDLMIVGADRIAANGDTANKIGTFEKAIVANTFGIPFYIAAPTSTFDLSCNSGTNIPIEERSDEEVLYQSGFDENGILRKVRVASPGSSAINPAFDATPARFITGIITEKGIIGANPEEISKIVS
jgi:S-methyl-5-thioribose-1-phosphate isomerase